MEPELPSPRLTPEQSPREHERAGEQYGVARSPEQGLERLEQSIEQRADAARAEIQQANPVLPAVIVPVPVADPAQDQTTVQDDDLPAVAGDDDLIEKEWVDKAKQIISATKDDPHKREQEVSRLQADYLRKRYGKELGSSDA